VDRVPIVAATVVASFWTIIVLSLKMGETHSLGAKIDLFAIATLGMVVIMMLGLGIQWLAEDIGRRQRADL